MIWLTWRQFRVQALVVGTALAVLAIYLVFLGLATHHDYSTAITGCTGNACDYDMDQFDREFNTPILLTTLLMVAVPGLLGVFWGAPLIAREFEAGTYRLVWNQSVTRERWLVVKLAVIAGACAVVTGLLSLLLSWAADPFDKVEKIRFMALVFGARDITPLSYAVFAFVLGSTLGLLLRRTVAAMALTLVVFAVVQLVMPFVVRPHLMPAKTVSVAFTADTMKTTGLNFSGGPDTPRASASVGGYQLPSDPTAWILNSEHPLLTASGSRANGAQLRDCLDVVPPEPGVPSPSGVRSPSGAPNGPGTPGGRDNPDPHGCLAAANLHFEVSYQPSSRYWIFQTIETALFLGLSALLAGFCFWRIRRGPA
jgi:ABC-type transport system involved in multi-copper enzyme maturation permease subunit